MPLNLLNINISTHSRILSSQHLVSMLCRGDVHCVGEGEVVGGRVWRGGGVEVGEMAVAAREGAVGVLYHVVFYL